MSGAVEVLAVFSVAASLSAIALYVGVCLLPALMEVLDCVPGRPDGDL